MTDSLIDPDRVFIKRVLKTLHILTAYPNSTAREIHKAGGEWETIDRQPLSFRGFREFIRKMVIAGILIQAQKRTMKSSNGGSYQAYEYKPSWSTVPSISPVELENGNNLSYWKETRKLAMDVLYREKDMAMDITR